MQVARITIGSVCAKRRIGSFTKLPYPKKYLTIFTSMNFMHFITIKNKDPVFFVTSESGLLNMDWKCLIVAELSRSWDFLAPAPVHSGIVRQNHEVIMICAL